MIFYFTTFHFPLLLSVLITASALFTVMQRSRHWLGKPLFYLVLSVLVYSFFYFLETAAADVAQKEFFSSIKYIGAVMVPVFFLLFSINFSSWGLCRRNRLFVFLLFIIPVMVILFIWIPRLHSYIFTGYELLWFNEILLMRHLLGPVFWVHFVYSYLLTLAGAGILLRGIISGREKMKGSIAALVVGCFIPLLGNMVHLFGGFELLQFLDLTSFSFSFSSALFVFVMVHYRVDDYVYLTHNLLLKNLKEGIIVLDHETRIVEINSSGAALFNRTPEDMTGQILSETVKKNKAVLDRFKSVFEAESEVELLVGDEKRICQIHISPLQDRRLPSPGRIVLIWDVTARRKAEEQAANASRLESLELLAGGIAHDFNNLLTGITGNLTLARLENGSETISEHLDSMASGLGQAAALTRQLQGFSAKTSPVSEPFLLKKLVEGAVYLFLRGTPVISRINLPDNLWEIFADPGQIVQVINNLVLNSLQAQEASGGGTISVSAENTVLSSGHWLNLDPGRYVHVLFKDEGPGIEPEFLQRIFDPYFTTKETGTGLGLASAFSLVSNNGGTIYAESGKGARFHLYLPSLGRRPLPVNMDAAGNERKIKGISRILLAEKDRDTRLVLRAYLSRTGYDTQIFSSLEAVFEYVERRDIPEVDCIIVSADSFLQKEIDDLELKCRTHNRNLPIIHVPIIPEQINAALKNLS